MLLFQRTPVCTHTKHAVAGPGFFRVMLSQYFPGCVIHNSGKCAGHHNNVFPVIIFLFHDRYTRRCATSHDLDLSFDVRAFSFSRLNLSIG